MTTPHPFLRYLATTSLCLFLASCGGGSTDVAGGPGTGGTGTRSGFVTGFGSIYIDGKKFDDSQVQPLQQLGSDQSTKTSFALGQRVNISYDTSTEVIKTAQLQPHLVGPVESIEGTGWIQVLGQVGRIATVAVPYLDRPGFVTQIASPDGTPLELSDIRTGSWVELHGHALKNMNRASVAATDGLLVTRIQVLAAPRSQALLTGLVSAIEGIKGTVSTADGRKLEFDASAGQLGPGQQAQVWLPTKDLLTWSASQSIRAVDGKAELGQASETKEGIAIMGQATGWNATTRELQINGQNLTIPDALLTPTLRQALSAQPLFAYCHIELTRSTVGATWTVTQITLANAEPVAAR